MTPPGCGVQQGNSWRLCGLHGYHGSLLTLHQASRAAGHRDSRAWRQARLMPTKYSYASREPIKGRIAAPQQKNRMQFAFTRAGARQWACCDSHLNHLLQFLTLAGNTRPPCHSLRLTVGGCSGHAKTVSSGFIRGADFTLTALTGSK